MGQSAEGLRREIAESREHLGTAVDAIGDRVSPGRIAERQANQVRNRVRDVREGIMGTASGATDTIGFGVGGAAQKVSGSASGAAEKVKGAPQSVKQVATRQTQGAPLAAGLVAFGAGALVAALLKPSPREGQVAQTLLEKAEPVKEAASDAGNELASGLKEEGQQSVEQVKEKAVSATEQVKETAQQSAERTTEAGRDASQQVKDQVQGAAEDIKPS